MLNSQTKGREVSSASNLGKVGGLNKRVKEVRRLERVPQVFERANSINLRRQLLLRVKELSELMQGR